MLAMGLPEWNVDGILELMDQMRAGEYAKLSNAVVEVGKKDPIRLKDSRDSMRRYRKGEVELKLHGNPREETRRAAQPEQIFQRQSDTAPL